MWSWGKTAFTLLTGHEPDVYLIRNCITQRDEQGMALHELVEKAEQEQASAVGDRGERVIQQDSVSSEGVRSGRGAYALWWPGHFLL